MRVTLFLGLALAFCLLASPALAVDNVTNYTTPGTTTYTVPAGYNTLIVEVWGAGGGGGGAQSNVNRGAGGGGGSAYSRINFSVTPGQVFNVTVGANGTGGVGSNNGTDGGNSSFNWTNGTAIAHALGGRGGTHNNFNATPPGGIGGNASQGVGTTRYWGGKGGNGVTSLKSGGGGGGAGSTGDGGNASESGTDPTGGTGTAENGGNGGVGNFNLEGNGALGSAFGGGGSGATCDSACASKTGGNGASGLVKVTATVVTQELTLQARNAVNASLVSGLCILATGTNTTQNLCNSTGTSVSFNTTGLYNISFYSLGVGDNSTQTYFNASVQNYNFSVSATLEANTSQALLAVSAYRLFLGTLISTFNATNNQAFNSTSGGALLLPANNGSNSVQVQVPGNYTLNASCPVTTPLSTVACDATGVYDGRYEFNASDARNGTVISAFNVTLSNASINASSINTTTNGNATINLLQGYTYNFTFRGPGYATQSKILPSNQSYHKYEFLAFTRNSVNISFYDEETGVFLSTTNVSVNFISDVESRNETAINGTLFVDLLTPANYTLRYSATGYFTRFYEFELFDNTFNSLNLTLLNSTTGEEVTINVKDTLNNPIEGALVRIHKYDITTNTYPLIEVVTTNFEGQTLASLVLNDEFYKFIIEVDGEVVLETSSTQIYGTELTFVVDIGAITGFGEAFTQFQLSGDVSYLNTTQQFDFTYNDASNTATQACLYVYTLGDEKELYNSTCTSSPSGTILVGIANETGTFYQAIGIITVGGINYTIDTEYASFGELLPEDGSGLFMMMVMVIIFATAAAASIELAIVVSSGVPFLFVLMGMVKLDYGVTLALFAGGVVLAFTIGLIRR